jgi:hypothetical protein
VIEMPDQVFPDEPDPDQTKGPRRPRRATVPSELVTGELSDAADAHLLIRTALLHPERTERVLHELFTAAPHATVAPVPVSSLATAVVMEFGPDALKHAADESADPELAELLTEVFTALCLLRSDIDAFVHLDRSIVRILDNGATDRQGVAAILSALTAGAAYVGLHETDRVAQLLLEQAVDTASARADDLEDGEADHYLRMLILARLAALDPGMAARCAQDLATVDAGDPGTEVAQRDLAARWWRRAVELLGPDDITGILESADGPDEVRTVLLTLSDPRTRSEPAAHLTTLPGPVVFTSVTHAIALISAELDDPSIPLSAITPHP